MGDRKFQDRYRIASARMPNWDYGSNADYFVTICTKNRGHYFGNIVETRNSASLQPTAIGKIAIEYWNEIPKHFPFVELDEFVIMPNHVHGILRINKPNKTDWVKNKFGIQSQNLGSILRGYKAAVKKYATMNGIEFSWQSRFHDRVIRTNEELRNVREYICKNPTNWEQDRNNAEDLLM